MILKSLKLYVYVNSQYSILILYQFINFGFELHNSFETNDSWQQTVPDGGGSLFEE